MQQDPQEYFDLREERRQARHDRMELFAGLSDFFAVVLGTVVILLLVLLIISLVNWLSQDISSTFTILNSRL